MSHHLFPSHISFNVWNTQPSSLSGVFSPCSDCSTFFLGYRDFERRRRLLQHRLDLHKLGATDEQLLEEAPEFHPNHIRHPATPPPQDIGRRGVWRLAGSSVVRESVPDMKDGCEDAISTASVHPVSRREGDGLQGLEQLLATTRGELELAGLPAGGPAPWGGILSTPQPPHYSFMGDWVEAAAQQCTVVLLALPGHPSAQGSLQQMLEERGVPFTGPASVAADLCADRYQMITTLSQLQYDGSMINLPLVHNISAPELEKQCETERGAEEFFSHLFGDWPDKMMIIRPARCAGGLGVARIASGEDLRTYAAAVKQWAEVIPQEYLTSAVADVDMPLPPPTQFVVEPFLPATPLELKVDDGEGENAAVASNSSGDDAVHRRLSWPTKDSWLAVRACMLGDAGAMRCLGLSTEVIKVAREADGEDVVVGSFDLNPPPAHILHPAMAADAHARMALIADRLGLSGAAEISALISATDGGLVVLDIDPHPDISPEGLLMRQAAAAATNPLEPRDVLRELLKVGMSRGEDLGGNLSLGMDSASLFSSEDYVGDAPAALDGKDPPSPALQWYGDAYEKIEFTADEDDEDEEFVAQQARGASKKRFTNNDAYEELLPDEDDDGDGTTGEDGDDLDLPEEGALDG